MIHGPQGSDDTATPRHVLTPLARQLIGRVSDRSSIPRYGSPTWDMLADQDPRRAAAIMIAAEAWRDHCSPERVASDLLAEILERDLDIAARVRETSWDIHAALYPEQWNIDAERIPGDPHVSTSPSHAELVRRRAA